VLEARTSLETGIDPRTTAVGAETLKAICEDYQKRDGHKLRTAKWRKDVLAWLVYPMLGSRPIAEIRRSEIVRLLDQIEDENGPVMADRTLAIIQRVMNWHAGRTDDFSSPILMIKSAPARTVLKFRWPFVAVLLAFAIYLGQFDFLLEPKALPAGPPFVSSTYPPIYVQFFETRSEAEHVCGKNNISLVEDAPTDARYGCSDWYDQGPKW
jgi:hypothetical protein